MADPNKTPIVFAVAMQDARNYCINHGLKFEDVVWVMNAQLLGSQDRTGAPVHYTDMFRTTPAFEECVALYGDGEEASA